jgi:hypothetical protein
MRWCSDDEHAHTGTIGLAVFRADSAAKPAAVAAADEGSINRDSELGGTDTRALCSSYSAAERDALCSSLTGPDGQTLERSYNCAPQYNRTHTAADDSATDAAPVGRAVTGPVGHAVCRTDISTESTANVESVLAPLDCAEHMRVRICESMRWCSDDEHAHTGTIGLAVFRADSAAKPAAVAAANEWSINRDSELGGTDTRALCSSYSFPLSCSGNPCAHAIAKHRAVSRAAERDAIFTALYHGAFTGALIGTVA